MIQLRTNKIYYLWIVLFIFISNFSIFAFEVQAKDTVNFSQSILPVKFVYLDKKNQISSVWENVKETDSIYVVKFFSKKNKEEVVADNSLLSKFRRSSIKYEENNLQTLRVDFFEKNNKLEEVHTYV